MFNIIGVFSCADCCNYHAFLCEENSWLFSVAVAAVFTMGGNLIAQFATKRVQISKLSLQKIGVCFLGAIICSLGCRFLIIDIIVRNTSIIVINLILALGTVLYFGKYKV